MKKLIFFLIMLVYTSGCSHEKNATVRAGYRLEHGGKIGRFLSVSEIDKILWIAKPRGGDGGGFGPTEYLVYVVLPCKSKLPKKKYQNLKIDAEIYQIFKKHDISIGGIINSGIQVDVSSIMNTSHLPLLAVQENDMIFLIFLIS